jgi:hypothetical protein
MARSVEITTPIPTLEEVGDSLGLSKARRSRLLSIVRNSNPRDLVVHSNKSGGFVTRSKGSSGGKSAGGKSTVRTKS